MVGLGGRVVSGMAAVKSKVVMFMSLLSASVLLGLAAILAVIGQQLNKMGKSFLKDIEL